MSGWKPRRFWKETRIQPEPGGGWGLRLDARPLRTPAKTPLVVPTPDLAHAIAAEWEAQSDEVRPASMPLTRMANSAIDKVAPQHAAVVAEVARYGASDLLCYRAVAPADLVARQAAVWDGYLDWADQALGARLRVTAGVVPVAQPEAAVARLTAEVAAQDPFALVGLHDLVAISGSLVIGLAVARRQRAPAEAFAASRIDEAWQAELWGLDDEAAAAEADKRAAFETAATFLHLCRADGQAS